LVLLHFASKIVKTVVVLNTKSFECWVLRFGSGHSLTLINLS